MGSHIENLIMEVTRKCNLTCEHCLRGDSQRMNFNPDNVIQWIKDNNITSIRTITVTGGEPFLNAKGIKRFFDSVDVEINCIYLVTNGTIFNEDVLAAIFSMNKKCPMLEDSDGTEGLILQISEDDFHFGERNEGWNVIKWSPKKGRTYHDIDWLTPEGRAKDNGFGSCRKLRNPDPWVYHIDEGKDFFLIEGEFYISSNGMITRNCDLSYKSITKRQIGNIKKDKFCDLVINHGQIDMD